jgi:hypothetical protein
MELAVALNRKHMLLLDFIVASTQSVLAEQAYTQDIACTAVNEEITPPV